MRSGAIVTPPPAPPSKPPEPAPGTERLNPADGLTFVYIPAGQFQMGCSGEAECLSDEKPVRQVRITRPFWMGQTEVTVGAWKKLYGKPPSWSSVWPVFGKDVDYNPGWANDRLPVIGPQWSEAHAFCEATGGRLPTEAEWEYAARATTTGSRYDSNLDRIARYGDNSGRGALDTDALWKRDPKAESYAAKLRENGNAPHAVGLKLPNPWNLKDILGNLWEWTQDWYGNDHYAEANRANDNIDPAGPKSGQYRVVRGGSWDSNASLVRVSNRSWFQPVYRFNVDGFRCVRDSL